MDLIRRSEGTKFVIFSASMSSLEALNGFKMELDVVFKIVKDYLINAGNSLYTHFYLAFTYLIKPIFIFT